MRGRDASSAGRGASSTNGADLPLVWPRPCVAQHYEFGRALIRIIKIDDCNAQYGRQGFNVANATTPGIGQLNTPRCHAGSFCPPADFRPAHSTSTTWSGH
jgi:hypothetical protein